MNQHDTQYHQLVKTILSEGSVRTDRTGVGTKGIFGYQLRFDLNKGFPLLTTKRIAWKALVTELIWFLKGETNIKYLIDNNCHIWDEWADDSGELGPVYGKQWRQWEGPDGTVFDQIKLVIAEIKRNPDSRRLVVSAWNVADLGEMALQPCHVLFQFYVDHGKLSCHMYQRSADVFLGLPFNIASYAALTHMIARVCNLELGNLIISLGDAHLYLNHTDQVNTLLEREGPGWIQYPSPQLILPKVSCIEDYTRDIVIGSLSDYECHPTISAPVAV